MDAVEAVIAEPNGIPFVEPPTFPQALFRLTLLAILTACESGYKRLPGQMRPDVYVGLLVPANLFPAAPLQLTRPPPEAADG